MKTRLLWVAVVFAACVGFYFAMVKPALEPSRPSVTIEDLKKLRPPQLPPPELPRPVITEPVIPPPVVKPMALPVARVETRPQKMEVPIQDRATIDFSSGAPQIKTQGQDADELEKALKEMAEATKDLKIQPAKP